MRPQAGRMERHPIHCIWSRTSCLGSTEYLLIVHFSSGNAAQIDSHLISGMITGPRCSDGLMALAGGSRASLSALQCSCGVEREAQMELITVAIDKPDAINMILGQSHFIKTVEDLHEALAGSAPGIEFGLAFCEASGPALVRASGTSPELIDLAKKNALALSAGHAFVIFLGNAFPINVLNAVKAVPEVCHIFCATSNPLQVILVETEQGRGILGVVDGTKSKGIEGDVDITERKDLLRRFGYKLG